MGQLRASEHWTAESVENFTYRIAADFLAQVETKIEKGEVSRAELAQRLNRTPGRVSQLFNPGNLTVSSAVRLVRAAGMKVALVAYEDSDPDNNNGPINSAIFYRCWKNMGAPKTFFELTDMAVPVVSAYTANCNPVAGGASFSINGTVPMNTNTTFWVPSSCVISSGVNRKWGTICENQVYSTVGEIRNASKTSIDVTATASTAMVH